VEMRLADLKGTGDWRMFDGLATTLIQGPINRDVIAATEMLEDGVREMERRIAAVQATGSADGITREMARRPGSGFHPLILVVDEAQLAFMCPVKDEYKQPYGGTKATSRFFMAARKILNQGRAVNVVLWLGTQDPTNDNLPKMVREAAHIRASLVLGTEAQAKMALGDRPVDKGAAPHKLRLGLDKGTLVANREGMDLDQGTASITVRTHYVSGSEAIEVAERAKTRRAPVATRTQAEPEVSRDLLADLAAVLGGEPVKAADVPALLRKLAPGYPPYASITGIQVREHLARHGYKVPATGNRYPVDPAEVRKALASRPADETE